MALRKRQVHSVKSDRYISLMVTSNTASAGRFIRIPKLLFPVLALMFVGIIGVIVAFYVRFENLNSNLADINNQIQTLQLEKANNEELLSEELSEKDALISDLLISLEEKEEQLNTIELQAEEMWSKIEDLESIKDSIYEKLNEAPADIYETEAETSPIADNEGVEHSANIAPYTVSTSMSGIADIAEVYSVAAASTSSTDFLRIYEELLSRFSELESSIEQNYSALNELSDMTDAYLPYIDAIPSGLPIKDSRITCEYGYRIDPVTGKRNAFHYGLDFSAYYKQDIYFTAPGTVTFAGYTTDFGYNIIIDHGYGYATRYAHLSKLYVKKGDTVERGDVIGGAGSTGKSTGIHLHYEVHFNGDRVDPITYID